MGIHRDPVLVVETPSSPYGHRYIVLPDRIMGDADAAQLCSRLNREGTSEGSDWIGLSRLGMQKAFGGGRTGYQRVVLSGTNVAALTPELRQVIEDNLMSVLNQMDDLIQSVDWKDGETNLVVTSPLLSQFLTFDWKDLPPSTRIVSRQGTKPAFPRRLIPALGVLAVLIVGFFLVNGLFSGSSKPPEPSQPGAPANAPATVVASAEETRTKPPEKPVAAPPSDRPRWALVDQQIQENVTEATLDQTLLNLADEDKNQGWTAARLKKLAEYYLAQAEADLKAPLKENDKADTRAKLILSKRLNKWKTFGPIGKFHEQPEFARNFFPIVLKKLDDSVYANLLDQIFGKTEMVRLLVDDGTDTRAMSDACYDYLAFQQDRGLNEFPKHLERITAEDRDRFEQRRNAIDRLKGWPGKFERSNQSTMNLRYSKPKKVFDKWTLQSGDITGSRGSKTVGINSSLTGKLDDLSNFNILPRMLILKRQPKVGGPPVKVGTMSLGFEVSTIEDSKRDIPPRVVVVAFEFPLKIDPNLIQPDDKALADSPWVWDEPGGWVRSKSARLLNDAEEEQVVQNPFQLNLNPNLESPLIFPD